MNWRVKKLLQLLVDGEWHREILVGGVGVGTVEFCMDQGLVRTKRYNIRKNKDGVESYFIAVRITAKGKAALK